MLIELPNEGAIRIAGGRAAGHIRACGSTDGQVRNGKGQDHEKFAHW
jgi:hypothetical protein